MITLKASCFSFSYSFSSITRVKFPSRKWCPVKQLRRPRMTFCKAQALVPPPYSPPHTTSQRPSCSARLPPRYLGSLSGRECPIHLGHKFLFCALENTPHPNRITYLDCELWDKTVNQVRSTIYSMEAQEFLEAIIFKDFSQQIRAACRQGSYYFHRWSQMTPEALHSKH